MARYIDADALLNALKEERKNGNFVFTSKWIKEIIDNLPPADVVECIHITEDMIKGHCDPVGEQGEDGLLHIKQEVAREIFEEIEKVFTVKYPMCTNPVLVLDSLSYAELKKKYTESEDKV